MKHIMIFESFLNGKVICYHGTGNKTSDYMNIFKNGFKIGTGANYGPGIYSFYNIEDLINDSFYSKLTIIESEIINLDKFLITSPSTAKEIFGKFDIFDQVSRIMGETWARHNIDEIRKIEEDISLPFVLLDKGRYSREDSPGFKRKKSVLGKELKGWIFDEGHKRDSVWVVCYDEKYIIPKRYSTDLGKTWKKPTD